MDDGEDSCCSPGKLVIADGWLPMPDDAPFRCTSCDWRGECCQLNEEGDCPTCGEPAEPL